MPRASPSVDAAAPATGRRRARDVAPPPQHAFTHAPAALRIFRFAADSAPRVLELAHISTFLRECAVEFGSADAALPGALRCEYASGRYFRLIAEAACNAARCPWLAEKLVRAAVARWLPGLRWRPTLRATTSTGAPGARAVTATSSCRRTARR